jgi:twitching motility two-component system response regulator PilG
MSSPIKVLQHILTKKVSGRLTLGQHGDSHTFWRLHVGEGQLHYAGSALGSHDRLRYVLHHSLTHLLEDLPETLKQSEYDWLQQTWQDGNLSFNELRMLLHRLSQDALIQVLSLPQASFQFDRNIGLSSILVSMPFKDLVNSQSKTIRLWRALHPLIDSPLQRVQLVSNPVFSKKQLEGLQILKSRSTVTDVSEILSQERSFYDLAATFNLELITLVRALYPLLKAGNIELRPYLKTAPSDRPLIVCIDDSATVQRNVQLILETFGYQVKCITDPLSALSSLGREVPHLILLDINMPQLDGYSLCRMLRQCSALKEIPIIMLTGRDTILDKVRAKLLGATGYMTKPFQPQELADKIAEYINVGAPA